MEQIPNDKKTPPFSIHEALVKGWEAFFAHYTVFLPAVFLTVAISFASEYMIKDKFTPLTISAFVLGAVAQIIIGMGLTKIALKITAGEQVSFDDVFSVTHLFFPYIGASILYSLIIFGGLLLLIVPGLVWLVTYWLFPYVLIDTECGILKALSEAKLLYYKGVRGHIVLFFVIIGILNIAGALTFMVGLFLTIPITTVATAHVYRKLAAAHEEKT